MVNEIRHKNIVYITDLGELGGVETYVYQLIKKYHMYDIAVVYKTARNSQLDRLSKYCYTYKHQGQKIFCDVAIINYDSSIIDYITPEIWRQNLKEGDYRGIYQGIHADYTQSNYYKVIPGDDRVKEYLAITKYIKKTYSELKNVENIRLCYNPLDISDETKPLILVSATRLTSIKGKDRMIALAKELDKRGINYIWYVFTNDTRGIDSPNVIFMQPRLDVWKWICQADYVIQLSDSEACSYTINEALYRNVPVIVTPLPYLKEIGYKDKKTGYTLEFDLSNLKEVVDNILNIPKFTFKQLKDGYDKILVKSKSQYWENELRPVNVRVLRNYYDMYKCRHVKIGDIIEDVPMRRAKELVMSNLVEIM